MCGKKFYPTKRFAQAVRNKVLRRKRNRPEAVRVYECPLCGGWHLTKQEKRS